MNSQRNSKRVIFALIVAGGIALSGGAGAEPAATAGLKTAIKTTITTTAAPSNSQVATKDKTSENKAPENKTTNEGDIRAQMEQAFIDHKYNVVQALSNNNDQRTVEVLKEWSQKGSVPAMWLLSQKLYDAHQEQDSADWLYTALLGMRLDMATCSNNEVYNIGKRILNNYWQPATAASKYPRIMTQGINFSIKFFHDNQLTTYDSAWICRLTPKIDTQTRVLDPGVVQARRQKVYDLYLKDTGSKPEQGSGKSKAGPLNNQEMVRQLRGSGDNQ